MVEAIVANALSGLANGAVYPDIAAENTTKPYIVYQAVGGQVFSTLDSAAPVLQNSRVQVAVWASTRLEAATVMQQVISALVNPSVRAVAIGAPVSRFDSEDLLYGSTLDVSITY